MMLYILSLFLNLSLDPGDQLSSECFSSCPPPVFCTEGKPCYYEVTAPKQET